MAWLVSILSVNMRYISHPLGPIMTGSTWHQHPTHDHIRPDFWHIPTFLHFFRIPIVAFSVRTYSCHASFFLDSRHRVIILKLFSVSYKICISHFVANNSEIFSFIMVEKNSFTIATCASEIKNLITILPYARGCWLLGKSEVRVKK